MEKTQPDNLDSNANDDEQQAPPPYAVVTSSSATATASGSSSSAVPRQLEKIAPGTKLQDLLGTSQAPIDLHAYRNSRLSGKDVVVTGPDKELAQYYLRFPSKFLSGRWEMVLRRGGPDGPEICQIRKGGSLKDSFTIVWPDGHETVCQKRSHFNTQYEFQAGTEQYRWRADSISKSMYDYTLWRVSEIDLPEKERTPVAHWRTTSAAIHKAGCLLVHPGHEHEIELILAAALGLEGESYCSRPYGLSLMSPPAP
ncbi:hypothetical protein JCM10908_007357 [Rhodotorula pacifica]|uniref:uncharacterized protein n=1 Tax=Rhodotorula pacifica TaxID=1495444 RepID=UPI0031721501